MIRTTILKSEKARELYQAILDIQAEANPFIDEWNVIEEKKMELKKPYEDYKKEVEPKEKELKQTLDGLNLKAEALKEKLAPFLQEEINPQLLDTEDFIGIKEIDGEIYVEIIDTIEDFKQKFVTKRMEQKALLQTVADSNK